MLEERLSGSFEKCVLTLSGKVETNYVVLPPTAVRLVKATNIDGDTPHSTHLHNQILSHPHNAMI